jgi:acetyl esterase/lipase
MQIIDNIYYTPDRCDSQQIKLYLPECESFPVVVWMHGGGLEAGTRNDVALYAEYLVSRGIALASVEYRMYPYARYPDFIYDAAAAVACVKKTFSRYGNIEGIFVGGSSAGAYLSMMLCFDGRYLAPHKMKPTDITGYIHNAGQPTTHFNVLRERGMDPRRAVSDEAAPIYHIGLAKEYAPMLFIVCTDKDLEARYEQTLLTVATMKHFGYDMSRVKTEYLLGNHCAQDFAKDENGVSVLGKIIENYVRSILPV